MDGETPPKVANWPIQRPSCPNPWDVRLLGDLADVSNTGEECEGEHEPDDVKHGDLAQGSRQGEESVDPTPWDFRLLGDLADGSNTGEECEGEPEPDDVKPGDLAQGSRQGEESVDPNSWDVRLLSDLADGSNTGEESEGEPEPDDVKHGDLAQGSRQGEDSEKASPRKSVTQRAEPWKVTKERAPLDVVPTEPIDYNARQHAQGKLQDKYLHKPT